MSVYVVGAIEIHDFDRYEQYRELSRKALAEFKEAGYEYEPLSADDNPTIFEGTQPANHLMVLRFNSREDYETFFASESYQRALPHRLASSTTRYIMAMDSL